MALLLALFILSFLALNAWMMSPTRLQWQLQLATLEFGHWLALLSLVLIHPAIHSSRWLALLFLLLSCAFLGPAFQASRIAKAQGLPFSWLRLWLPLHTRKFEVHHERRTYWRQEDESLDIVIYRPVGADKPLPCLLIAHTGGWDSGDPGEFTSANAELASHGYVVCSFGYRLAPKHKWPAQSEDTLRAFEWIRDHAAELGIDTHRIVLMGRSAGAQIAAACAYGRPELGACGCISVYGTPNMHLAREWALPDDLLKSLTLVRQYMGGDPHEAPDAYRTASATAFLETHSLPTLLIHGTLDSLVGIGHSRRFTELRSGRDDHHFLELPWGTHGTDYFPSTPGGQLSMAAILRFMERFVHGSP
ncbi:MAG: alpha/beta hydrolase [Prosthecobacter sp.]|uniref:alpha/beta hydrolase n=1 Tax=Prosthecobacter sp. TaxID=1965333 RepID=UPI0039014CAD